jgi:mono/diheme cytochrome c family protein
MDLRTDRNLRLLAALFLTFTLGGFAAADDAAGKSLFNSNCAICHGPNGDGNSPIGKTLNIPDFHSAQAQKMTEAEMKAIVANGKNKMPAFKDKLTDVQIDQVVDYVRHLGK